MVPLKAALKVSILSKIGETGIVEYLWQGSGLDEYLRQYSVLDECLSQSSLLLTDYLML